MKILNELMELKTDDYQNRDGEYPKANIPDSIDVFESKNTVIVTAYFKNTEEHIAIEWLKNKLSKYKVSKIEAYQTGDYQDDWVDATAEIKI